MDIQKAFEAGSNRKETGCQRQNPKYSPQLEKLGQKEMDLVKMESETEGQRSQAVIWVELCPLKLMFKF